MADVVISGGGLVGLCTAMLLADGGHHVTVLERDPATPPGPDDAWEGWERRGVNQFRLLHFFLPRFRAVIEAELPQVVAALDRAGANRYNPMALAPAEVTGGWRAGDEAYESITARRPVAEAAVAAAAEATPGVTIRRGVAIAGLRTGREAAPGIPHVTGVVTEGGEEIVADVVVDASGRRSPLPAWLAAIGARPLAEQLDDSGFVYYGRHFQSADGAIPPAFGALLQSYDSVSMLTLPADRGTWGVGVIASAKDADLRVLRDNARWEAVVRSYPLIAHWLDGRPLDDVTVMAKLEDRHRDLVVDGTPVATGIVAIGDAWACTNPSLGRGISIGMMQAVAFRDVLARQGTDDPLGLVCAWAQATAEHAEPWYQSTLAYDRHRLAEVEAQIEGRPYEPGDPAWDLGQCLFAGAGADPELLRAALGIGSLLVNPDELFADAAMAERVATVGGPLRGEPAPGPSRAELLSIVHA